MGLLRALVDSAVRFSDDLLPVGYHVRDIRWVVNIDPSGTNNPVVENKGKGELPLRVPAPPADRTARKVSPALLVDKPSYTLGCPDLRKKGDSVAIARNEQAGFIELLQTAATNTHNSTIQKILNFITDSSQIAKLRFASKPKPNELIAFQVGSEPWPTDIPEVQRFWSEYIEKRFVEKDQKEPSIKKDQACVCCGQQKKATRILPFQIKLFNYSPQLSSFNESAFCSHGNTKNSDSNAPICYLCTSVAGQVLQHLLEPDAASDGKVASNGRHMVILARDETRGPSKQSLRNQVAVFWTKDAVVLGVGAEATHGRMQTLEEMIRAPLVEVNDPPGQAPPAYASQLRDLLQAPYQGGKDASELATNRFFLAVLSPNKSRLVVREWLEQGVEPVRQHVKRYLEALQITHPDGRGIWFPPLPALLWALRSLTSNKKEGQERPRLPQVGPDVMRKLIRCVYAGLRPPEALLLRAIRCFRVPDPLADQREQAERQMLRRMAMAAAMKLILTYSKSREEQRAMEELRTEHDESSDYKRQSPYLCGRLLAVLEAVQRRSSSSGRGVNTTLVDRFYGAASTAPATVFANLINLTTKAHLPKLRREGKEFFRTRSSGDKSVNINDLMAEVCVALDNADGFPPPLTPVQQAQFALGFYHQRAELHSR